MTTRLLQAMHTTCAKTQHHLRTLYTDETGLTALGYAMLIALTALSALVAWNSMGEPITIEGASVAKR